MRRVTARHHGPIVAALWGLTLVGCGGGPEPAAPATQAASAATVASSPASAPATSAPPKANRAPVGDVPLGGACGGANGVCDAQGYCKFPEADACGEAGAAGVCTARPRGCRRNCPRVCTCSGASVCNSCSAKSRGFAVRHKGRCVEEVAP